LGPGQRTRTSEAWCTSNANVCLSNSSAPRVANHHVTRLLKPSKGCVVVICVVNDTCGRRSNFLDRLGDRESCLEADQSRHRHSRHLASKSRHVSNAHLSLEAHASRPLNRARIAISNSHQFRRLLQEPMKAWTNFGGIDGKND